MNLKLKILAVVSAIILQLTFGGVMYLHGHDTGFSAAESKHQKADIAALNGVIANTEKLTKAADAASLAINKSIVDRQAADRKTTQDFKHALSTTAHLRVSCVFDNNIMRQLSEAADRADQATTSGIVGAMPTRTKAK